MWNPSEVCIVCSSAIETLTDGSGHSVASLIMIFSGWPDIPILTACVPNYVISSCRFNQLLTAEQQELFRMKVSIISVSLILLIAMSQIGHPTALARIQKEERRKGKEERRRGREWRS